MTRDLHRGFFLYCRWCDFSFNHTVVQYKYVCLIICVIVSNVLLQNCMLQTPHVIHTSLAWNKPDQIL